MFQRIALFSLVFGTCSVLCGPTLAAENMASAQQKTADIQEYQRQSISIYQPEDNPLDAFLVTLFQRELPRFDYPVLNSNSSLGLADFLNLAFTHQQEHAGELAAGNEIEDLRFEDKLVTWTDTQRLMNSAYVFAPRWDFSPLQIEGPDYSDQMGASGWYIVLKSTLTMDLPLYKLGQTGPQKYASFQESWQILKLLRIEAIDQIRARMRLELGLDPKPEDTQAFMQALRQLQPFGSLFQALEAQDPAVYMSAVASRVLEAELSPGDKIGELSKQALSLGLQGSLTLFNPDALSKTGQLLEGVGALYKLQNLLAEIRKTPEFTLKGQVEEHVLDSDQVLLSLAGQESVKSLGIKLDAGYQIVEYLQQGDEVKPVEIGFVKVRQFNDRQVITQPIIVSRTFEPGDQYLERPKTNFELKLRGGIGSLILDQNLGPLDTAPEFSGELSYALASQLGWSETFLSLNGTFGMIDRAVTGQAPISAQVLTGEMGLSKRFYFRQWIFSLGARLGLMSGLLDQGQVSLSQQTYGGTVLGGLYYQLTPDFILGLDLGWREYLNGGPLWSGPQGDVNLGYGVGSSGPVAGVFLNYHL